MKGFPCWMVIRYFLLIPYVSLEQKLLSWICMKLDIFGFFVICGSRTPIQVQLKMSHHEKVGILYCYIGTDNVWAVTMSNKVASTLRTSATMQYLSVFLFWQCTQNHVLPSISEVPWHWTVQTCYWGKLNDLFELVFFFLLQISHTRWITCSVDWLEYTFT